LLIACAAMADLTRPAEWRLSLAGITFTMPHRPVRRRLKDISRFTITRGGEYYFLPGIRAMRWLSEPDR
jgi:hypothetical protein